MKAVHDAFVRRWKQLAPAMLPFADAASAELPLRRLLRLGLFQISVGMAVVLLNGTLNRVTILELGVPAWIVAGMVSLPLLFAPLRALIGHRSDVHRSAFGWRRVPYIWIGTLLQFGGFAIMPFALLILSGDTHGPREIGLVAAALAFLLVGAGLHTTQTAGLALATDLAPRRSHPRVVALLYLMLLVGMLVSALVFSAVLENFSAIRLVQVVQGAGLLTLILNGVALWKQEPRDPERAASIDAPTMPFRSAWRAFTGRERATRFLVAVGLGTAAFSMQDILLEPYGGEVLGLGVAATTELTAYLAAGTLAALAFAARHLREREQPLRMAAHGALVGLAAFAAIVFAAPLDSAALFRAGTVLIGLGGGLFAVGTLTAAMAFQHASHHGLVLGAWGAVQASAAGVATALGGALCDVVSNLAERGALGPAMQGPAAGYSVVYHVEILLLFATLVAIGPLIRPAVQTERASAPDFGLAQFPG